MAHARDRSPQRTSLDSIFAPLDPNERLPRERLIQDNRNWMTHELGGDENWTWTIWELRFGRQLVAGLLWAPAMLIVVGLIMLVTVARLPHSLLRERFWWRSGGSLSRATRAKPAVAVWDRRQAC
jgi:hypothetical protein